MPERNAEQIETPRDEVLVCFRRIGQNRVHFALVMPETLRPTRIFGAPATVIGGPVAAWCGRTLRGRLVEIPRENLDGWREQGHVCRECQMVARLAVAR